MHIAVEFNCRRKNDAGNTTYLRFVACLKVFFTLVRVFTNDKEDDEKSDVERVGKKKREKVCLFFPIHVKHVYRSVPLRKIAMLEGKRRFVSFTR